MNKFLKKIFRIKEQCECGDGSCIANKPKTVKEKIKLLDWNKARIEVLKDEAEKIKDLPKKDYADIMKILRKKVK